MFGFNISILFTQPKGKFYKIIQHLLSTVTHI